MSARWLSTADAWWSRDFGCRPEQLLPASTHVQAHQAGLSGSTGIWILVAGGAPLVSMPADVFAQYGERARAWTAEHVADGAALRRELGDLAPGRMGKI